MNGDYGESRLPELADEDVAVLYRICKVATRSNTSANNAIFSGYYKIFEDLERDTRHDNAIFRWITRLARVDDAKLGRRPDFVARLRALLEHEHGITVVDEEETQGEREAEQPAARRRSSFDDAQYEETWLSNHTQSIDGSRPGRNVHFSNHVRAISHDTVDRLSRDRPRSPIEEAFDHRPTDEEMEQWADTFYHTTYLQHARRCLQKWQIKTFNMVNENLGRQMMAAQHDKQLLQKQAWESWREVLLERREEHQIAAREHDCERRLATAPYLTVKRSIWNAWRAHFEDVKAVEDPAREHILRLRYFGRWKAIALENQGKARSILLRKYAGRWLDVMNVLTSRRKSARVTYEQSLLQQCLSIWADRVNTRRQQQKRQDELARQTIRNWRRAVHNTRRAVAKAGQVNRQQQCRAAFMALSESLQHRCAQELQADRIRDNTLLTRATSSLKRHASTLPALLEVRSAKRQRTKQDILTHWRQCTKEHQQAVQQDRRRLLKHALKVWNDALRIRTLDRRLNERVKAQTLYKLLIEARSRQCAHMIDSRRVRLCWDVLRSKSGDTAAAHERRIAHFDGEVQRRRLLQAVHCLHLQSRMRDDAERAATEFRNARLLPRAWQALRKETAHLAQLNAWSRDAGFFVATKKTIKTWRAKTEHSKQDKRHQAYVKARSTIKARLLRGAWNALQAKMDAVNDAQVASYTHLEATDEARVRYTLSILHRRTTRCKDMRAVAARHDRIVTERAAFATLVASHDNLIELDAQAEDMRFDVDLTTQAMVLKRLRFAAFALARLQENSTVYQKRHREQHARQMLRHLVHTMTERQARKQEEPDSPSLRPASRAASRPDADISILQSARRTTGTPAYLKTPSRARRSKLRTIPTPAPFTPFALTPGFLASTPGPAQSMLDVTAMEADDTLPQITPFNRRLRASGINTDVRPASILRSRQFGASMLATDKSVRFARASRFQPVRGQ